MNTNTAASLCQAVFDNFQAGENQTHLREFAPPHPGDRDSCFLWSYFATTGMLYQACKAGLGDLGHFRTLIDGFALYRAADMPEGLSKYHSERGEEPGGGHGPCFFDDNIWVARNLLFAHELLGDACYLAEAQRVARYTHTGWNDVLGGLVWNENGLGDNATAQELERGLSANACSILVNAQLYQRTGEALYLDWAHRFYAFCKTVQDEGSGMYYNGIHTLVENGTRRAGEVNRDLYGYNPGSMILADLALYEITKDSAYLADAERAATAAHPAFLQPGKVPWYRDFVWFTAILAEGCAALAQAGSEAGAPVMAVLEESLQYGLAHHRAENGLLPHDWVTGPRTGEGAEYDRMLLTHSGTAEIALLLCGAQ